MSTVFRPAFFLLLAVNAVLGLLIAWPLLRGAGTAPEGEAQRLIQQLNPERLNIVTAAEMAAAAPSAGASEAAAQPAQAVEATNPAFCVRLTRLSPAQAQSLAASARSLTDSIKVSTPVIAPTSFWVHIPPLPNRVEADARAEALRAAGVQELFVSEGNSGPANSISLGLYRSEAAAKRQLETLQKKGVQGVRIETRNPEASIEIAGVQELVERLAKEAASLSPRLERSDCSKP